MPACGTFCLLAVLEPWCNGCIVCQAAHVHGAPQPLHTIITFPFIPAESPCATQFSAWYKRYAIIAEKHEKDKDQGAAISLHIYIHVYISTSLMLSRCCRALEYRG